MKVNAPENHNWTHKRYARTLREAFPMDNDLYIHPSRGYDAEDVLVLRACLAAFVFLLVYFLWTR